MIRIDGAWRSRWAAGAILLGAIVAVLALGLDRALSLDALKAQQAALTGAYHDAPALFIAGFVALQAAALALLIPGAVIGFALVAGAVMGPTTGTAVVLAAVTLGDSLGFLIARYLLRDWFARRVGARAGAFQRAMDRDGAAYLLALRLMAMVPYFTVNVAMALTRMRLRVFAPVSLIGLAPATFLHVNAGMQLGRIAGPSDILSPAVIASFAALGLFPLAMRWLWRRRAARQAQDGSAV